MNIVLTDPYSSSYHQSGGGWKMPGLALRVMQPRPATCARELASVHIRTCQQGLRSGSR